MALRVLVIPGYRIFPMDSGGAYAQLSFLDKQQFQHDIHLIVTPDNIVENEINAFKNRFPKITLYPIGFQKPTFTKKTKHFFQKQLRKASGRDVSYALGKNHQANGLFIRDPYIVEQIITIAASESFDMIQVEHVKNLGLISVLPTAIKKIFVHHEVYHTRVYQDMRSLNYSDVYTKYMTSLAKAIEVEWLNQYDGIITFNQDDTDLLIKENVKPLQLVNQPFALFKDQLKKIYQPEVTPKLLFLGGETHYPNKEGLQWFLEQVRPILTSSGHKPELFITGNWTDDFKSKYQEPAICFTGFVENLDKLLTNAIVIVPIRIGSGVRIKVFTSIAKGLPIVSTALGASGIPGLAHKENILFGETAEAFAQGIIDLLTNQRLREAVSANVYRLAEKQFESNRFVEDRNEFYNKVLGT